MSLSKLMHKPHELEKKMGCESELEQSPILKLSLYSLPSKPPEPPGLVTPPLTTQVSIPFDWEEVPGKPRVAAVTTAATTTQTSKPKAARCLELPPRLLLTGQAKVTNMPSPTTVLDGPYVGRSQSSTFSYRSGSVNSFGKKEGKGSRGVLHFGSWRWGDLKENRDVVEDSFDFSPISGDKLVEEIVGDGGVESGGGGGGGCESDAKVKITKAKKRRSFMSVSHTKSHMWTSIYESLKQVVPWRRMRQRKLERDLG